MSADSDDSPADNPPVPPGEHGDDAGQSSAPADGETAEGDSEDSGSVAGTLARSQPLEPQEIDPENAAFFVLGAVLVVGFLFVAVLGI